jgi:hypothetical protein
MGMAKITETEQQQEGFAIPLRWGDASTIPTIYANHLFLTHAGGEFYLVFGELAPVTHIDKDSPPDCLEIKPVVKIAITSENMLGIAEAIQINVSRFKESLAADTGGKEKAS